MANVPCNVCLKCLPISEYRILYTNPHIRYSMICKSCEKEKEDAYKKKIDEWSRNRAKEIRVPYKQQKQQVIYLVKSGERTKIGITDNIKRRLRELQTGSPYPLEVIHWFNTDYLDTEKELHEKYKDKRVHGEWFCLSDTDIDQIKADYPYKESKFNRPV